MNYARSKLMCNFVSCLVLMCFAVSAAVAGDDEFGISGVRIIWV
jgi:hypothetical protein